MNDQHIEAATAAVRAVFADDEATDEQLATTAVNAWLNSLGLTAEQLERMPQTYFLSIYQHVPGDSMAARCKAWAEAIRVIQHG